MRYLLLLLLTSCVPPVTNEIREVRCEDNIDTVETTARIHMAGLKTGYRVGDNYYPYNCAIRRIDDNR